MEAAGNLIFGDPVYDCKGRVVRRNFGIKNIVIILAIVYGLYSLREKMAIKSGVKSGRRKLRGGSEPPKTPQTTSPNDNPNFMRNLSAGIIAFLTFVAYVIFQVRTAQGN